ncbi:MAG TPA: helix-turn-helix transcriptional regulator [Xanthobacteraceae bacterium]|jgi:transcriptional regulator with XRE-family HTH domain|nr:helix-turn-helix transcriptional regulator [Xanthobacteraceae bacterium]
MYNRALKLIREYHRLSRTEVAEKVGLSKSYVSELERGRKPTIEVIERYAETFRIPVSSLLLFAEYSENPNIPERARAFTADKVLKMLEWLRDTAGEDIDDDKREKLPSERLKAAAT